MAMNDPDEAVTRHNDLAADLVARLVRGTIGAGGDVIETLIVLESVVAGVCLTLVRLGGDEVVIDALKREVRMVPNLDGNGFVSLGRSSSDLSKAEMGDLMTLIEMFGAKHGVKFHEQENAA